MKLVKEHLAEAVCQAKEKLPVSFYSDRISSLWGESGALKGCIDTLGQCYTDADEAISILSDLMDSYLIAIGRLEALAAGNVGLSVPEVEEEELEPVKADIAIEDADEFEDEVVPTDTATTDFDDEELIDTKSDVETSTEPFEYFVDFDEPKGPRLTDEDLYN